MAGYNGYSMSNNAVDAYNDGEMPLSKWNKEAIINAIEDYISDKCYEQHTFRDEQFHFSMENLKKMTIKDLKRVALTYSSWHHTSSHFNQTSFYSLDINEIDTLTDLKIEEIILTSKKQRELDKLEQPKEVKVEKYECEFLIWSGTKSHPKAKEVREIGIIKGDWFYRVDGTKKSINANGFKILQKIEDKTINKEKNKKHKKYDNER